MGDVESGLRHAYLRLEPRLTRIAVVKGWIEQNTSEAENDSEITVAAATIAPAPSIKSHHQPDQSRDVKATIVPVPAPVSVAGAVTETRTKARMASVERVVAEARDVEAEERYSAITSQTLLARQLYISEVLGRIYARVDYPRRAQQLQQTGAIKFNLVIDGEGKIKSLKPIETSSYILLNKAAEEAVKDAAPFAPLPEILEDGELELFVPIRFSLTSSS
jgi:protein TonB